MSVRSQGQLFLALIYFKEKYSEHFDVPASYIMYLSDFCRFLLCTCEWERRGERGAGEGEGARERRIECILYGYS
jgi:hypothetical protein